jgi:hypothetical protein
MPESSTLSTRGLALASQPSYRAFATPVIDNTYNAPRGRAPETIPPHNAPPFGGGANVGRGDGDLMMNVWVARLIYGTNS